MKPKATKALYGIQLNFNSEMLAIHSVSMTTVGAPQEAHLHNIHKSTIGFKNANKTPPLPPSTNREVTIIAIIASVALTPEA